MIRQVLSLVVLFLFTGFIPKVISAEITWKLYLKPYYSNGPVLTGDGNEFVIVDYQLSGGQSQYRDILEDMEDVSFHLNQSPDTRPVEIRVILNVRGDFFEDAGSASTFFNVTFLVLVNGREQDSFNFSKSSPLIISIPVGRGLDNLLNRLNCTRRDNIMFVAFLGSGFEKDGIETFNQTSALRAEIDHTATIVGGIGDNFGYPNTSQYNTWSKIKLLFK
ncbi:MAG: hypothetical protein JXB48_03635 [Candidatus Latescibacteria bacterium]|nr:hypothetical protein [Candidatus Latescibacterota bacterium]